MQCAKCGGKGTVFGEGTASIPCPNCGGSGQVFPEMFQGCRHDYPPDHVFVAGGPHYHSLTAYPRSEKTLLDEYAIAAMGMFRPPMGTDVELIASDAFNVAAAMLREKMRRDEVGNVKEKEVEK